MKFIQVIEMQEWNNGYGPSDIVDVEEMEFDSVDDIELNYDWDWYPDYMNDWEGNPYRGVDTLVKVKYYYDDEQLDEYSSNITDEYLAVEFEEWDSTLRQENYDVSTETLKEACIDAMESVGYDYDSMESNDYGNYIKFFSSDGYQPTIFDSWCECFNWIRDVVLDDSEESVKMNDILDDHGYKGMFSI